MFRSSLCKLSLAILLTACGAESDVLLPVKTAGIGTQESPQAAVARVVTAFTSALEAGNEAGLKQHLTRRAQELYGTENGFRFEHQSGQDIALGAAQVTGTDARMPMTVSMGENAQQFEFLLRIEEGVWRLHGMQLAFGDSPFTVSFEGDGEELAEQLMGDFAEEFAGAIEESFEGAMDSWQAGGTPEEIAAEHASFAALATLDEDRWEAAWTVSFDAAGRSARALLEQLLDGSGFTIDAGEHAPTLDRELELELSGLSRAEAIERVCTAIELVPVFTQENTAWGNEAPQLSFEAGPRTLPATFAGPFVVTYTIEESAPQTTGSLEVQLWAFGLPAEALAANAEMGEFLGVTGISGPHGSVRVDDDVQYWGSPTITGNALSYSVVVGLKGLLRDVEQLEFEGALHVALPTNVVETRFDEPGTVTLGDWQVECEALAESSEFKVSGVDDASTVEVRFAPLRADGSELGILSQGSSDWGDDRVHASLSTPEKPGSVVLRVFESNELVIPIRSAGLDLVQHADQPATLEMLTFKGSQPIDVTFQGFPEATNPDFPEVSLAIVSTANKPVLDAQVTFEYLDASGAVAKEFPHTLSGEFTFGGSTPLVDEGETVEHKAAAFFMPEGTQQLRVRVDRVSFEDGTRWERP